MGVSSITLGRPWMYDHDAILYGRSNSCSFTHNGKKIVIHFIPPKDNIKKGTSHLKDKKLGMNLISAKELECELSGGAPIWVLSIREVQDPPIKEQPQEVTKVSEEFKDVFLEDLPNQLSPLRDIQHAIDLVLSSTLPNLPHYRMNPTEHSEMQ